MESQKCQVQHYINLSLENIVEEIDGVVYVEEWRDIKGYEGYYQVSNFGRVKSLDRHVNCTIKNHTDRLVKSKVMPQRFDIDKYLRVNLSKPHKYGEKLVSRLVAIAFLPNPENKKTVNHKWGIKTNNMVWELEWATMKEQIDHSLNTGLKPVGERHYLSCLSNESVKEIKRRLINGEKSKNIYKDYSVSKGVIDNIKYGNSYKQVII